MDDVSGDAVQEVTVMTHNDQRLLPPDTGTQNTHRVKSPGVQRGCGTQLIHHSNIVTKAAGHPAKATKADTCWSSQ